MIYINRKNKQWESVVRLTYLRGLEKVYIKNIKKSNNDTRKSLYQKYLPSEDLLSEMPKRRSSEAYIEYYLYESKTYRYS